MPGSFSGGSGRGSVKLGRRQEGERVQEGQGEVERVEVKEIILEEHLKKAPEMGFWKRIREWRKERVRVLVEWGPGENKPYHVTITPRFAISIPWFGGRRVRFAGHHGLQVVEWNGVGRWVVEKQVLGRSRVKGELFSKES